MDTSTALLRWSVLLLIVRWAFSRPVRRILGDASGGFVVPFVWMAIGYAHWLISHLSIPVAAKIPLAVALASAVILITSEKFARRDVPETPARASVYSEAVFWALFLSACAIRSWIPGWTGSEKFPDLMYFQSALQDPAYPPFDRWLFPLRVNYYYMSYALFAPFVKIAAIPASIAVNLLCATVIAMLGAGSFAFVFNWTRSAMGGLVAALFAAVLGNAEWILQAFQGRLFAGFSWWNSSRAIPFAITEFPFFSFLLGDLHPHYNALPWFALAMWMVFRMRDRALLPWVALAIGIQYPLNAWQFPVVVLTTVWVYRRAWFSLAALGALSYVFFIPFWLTYARPVSGIYGVEAAQRTQSFQLILHWAPFMLLSLCAWWTDPERKRPKAWHWAMVGALCAGAFLDRAAIAVIGLWFGLLWASPMEKDERFAWSFFVAILMFCEFFSLDPTYGYDYFRMNTVFKFYILAWWIFAVFSAIRLSSLGWTRPRVACLLVAVLAGSVYPILGTRARLGPRPDAGHLTLDGAAYWNAVFPGERQALDWILHNTSPTDAILEAVGPAYQEYGRYSVFSGRPNLTGWLSHEQVWRRNGFPLSAQRAADLDRLKSNPTSHDLNAFLKRYAIRWIVIGKLERQAFGPALIRFLAAYPLAFEGSGVTIHAVP